MCDLGVDNFGASDGCQKYAVGVHGWVMVMIIDSIIDLNAAELRLPQLGHP